MSPDLALALALADAADAISLGRFRATRPARRDEARPDAGDRGRPGRRDGDPRHGSRASARTTACSARSSASPAAARRRWIVDPIDGTRNYSRGIPVWATLIALEEDGRDPARRRLGACPAPPLARRARRRRLGQRRPDPGLGDPRRSRTRCSRSRSSSRSRRSPATRGTPAATATSGPTCWSRRVRSTAPSTRSA